MTNGQQNYQLTQRDIENGVRSGMQGVEMKLDRLTTEVQGLNQRINEIERSKLQGKINSLENVKPDLQMIKMDIQDKIEVEEERIQKDYDENMYELIQRLVDQIQTNTETLDMIQSEYGELEDIRRSLFNDLENIDKVYNFNYRTRDYRLKNKRKSIEENFDKFLEHRKNVKALIDSLKSDIPVDEPVKCLVPIWVCGTMDRLGNQKTYIYTPSEISSPNNSPSERQPYVEHLEPIIKEKIELSEEEKRKAESNSIIKRDKLDRIFDYLEDIRPGLDFIDKSRPGGGSLFLSKLKKFVKHAARQNLSSSKDDRRRGVF